MLIGIVSDSHDDMKQIKKAVDFLNSKGVSHVLHAGDLVSPFTFEVFGYLKCSFAGIFGNNDGDRVLLTEKSEGRISVQPLITGIDGRRVAVVHEPGPVEALASSGHFDLVIYGHTHVPEIRKVKDAIVVNPGKIAVLHKGESTLAIHDTETGGTEIVRL